MAQNSPYPDNSFPAYTEPSMNSYADNNLPRAPPHPPQRQGSPGYPTEPTRARGPSIGGLPIPSTPPVQNVTFAPPPQIQATPPQHDHPSYLMNGHQPQQPTSYPQQYPNNNQQPYPPDTNHQSAYIRPPIEPRRLSASSAHSRHSHDSHRSHRSGRSSTSQDPDRRRSRDYSRSRSRDYNHDEKTHKHHHHHGHGEEQKPLKRVDSHRPTWGDTIYGLFGAIKTSLRPSD